MISVKRYGACDAQAWDAVVLNSRNGNFLHMRPYMDYHADRFVDGSMMVLRDDTPIAVFPASIHGASVSSHGGLTYGGLISTFDMRAETALSAFEKLLAYFRAEGQEQLIYKAVPHAFHKYPCEEDLYALFRLGARLIRRDLSSIIEIGKAPAYNKGRKWTINKAKKLGIVVNSSHDFVDYYALMAARAAEMGRNITHTLDELVRLKGLFPNQIVLFEARMNDDLQAGVLIYDFGATVHTQYMSSSETGRANGALDLIIATLVDKIYAERRYLSFGISTEELGLYLNSGLVAQKEGFGARACTHDFYELLLK